MEDLAPILESERPWDAPTFAAAWLAMILSPATLSGGASLLSLGLSVPEAALSHGLGGVVLLAPLIASAWPGVRYGIPYPVFARASFGYHGAQFCTLSRGLVAVMWLSFQLWQGSLALAEGLGSAFGHELVDSGRLDPSLTTMQLLLFLGFSALHMLAVALGPERFKPLVKASVPLLLLGLLALVLWAAQLASFEAAMAAASSGRAGAEVRESKVLQWMSGVNSAVSGWSTLVLNVCDLSRFAPSQRAQIFGQSLGLPLPYAFTGFVGAWIAGATLVASGEALWEVPRYFALMPPWAGVLGGGLVAVSILAVNVVANMLSPINDLLNLAPLLQRSAPRLHALLTFRACAATTLLLAMGLCPWWTFSTASNYILVFLNGYAMVTGAITGVILTDFWALRRGELDVAALYAMPGGGSGLLVGGKALTSHIMEEEEEEAPHGIEACNWRAFAAVGAAVAPCLPGFAAALRGGGAGAVGEIWRGIYRFSWLVTFAVSALVYWSLELSAGRPRPKMRGVPAFEMAGSQITSPLLGRLHDHSGVGGQDIATVPPLQSPPDLRQVLVL